VGFGEACRLAAKEMDSDHKHILALNKLMREEFEKRLTHITVNGDIVFLAYFHKNAYRIKDIQEI